MKRGNGTLVADKTNTGNGEGTWVYWLNGERFDIWGIRGGFGCVEFSSTPNPIPCPSPGGAPTTLQAFLELIDKYATAEPVDFATALSIS